MQKQLNPKLFSQLSYGGKKGPSPSANEFETTLTTKKTSSLEGPAHGAKDSRAESGLVGSDGTQVLQQLTQTWTQKLNQMSFQMEETLLQMKQKVDRLQSVLAKLEQSQDALSLETQQRLNLMQQKTFENRKIEEQVQHLIDRQNTLLKGYEVKLALLQKT